MSPRVPPVPASPYLPVSTFVLSIVSIRSLSAILQFKLVLASGAPSTGAPSPVTVKVSLDPRHTRLLLSLLQLPQGASRDLDGWCSREKISAFFGESWFPVSIDAVSHYASQILRHIRKAIEVEIGAEAACGVSVIPFESRPRWGYRIPPEATLRIRWPSS